MQLCQQAEKAGVAWITVHGRTTRQRGEPANWEAIKLVPAVKLPIVMYRMDFLLKLLSVINYSCNRSFVIGNRYKSD